mmetsp:Transcript_1854/g.4397  ORF Transcript_1854/g.4397 Transcript_1854/m.4397 type:complete len:319 (+) Transcript_1854:219-1175(+)
MPPSSVVVHPLVLLSVVDHYNRVAKNSRKRVVGVLLGETYKGKVDVTNSFAVPFEEDSKDKSVFYLDHHYLETMYTMFQKVNSKEKIVGFYSTGPKIKPCDLAVDALFRRYHKSPALVIIDVRPECEGMPTSAYVSVETVAEGGKETQRAFQHVPSEVGAYEAEEVGVEHLLRDINDPSVTVLAEEVRHKVSALRALSDRLDDMSFYLHKVLIGELPPNNKIMYNLQEMLNLLPNIGQDPLVRAMLVKTNDMHLVMYMSSMVRCVTALHDLVNNKIRYRAMYEDEGAEAKTSAAAAEETKESEAKEAKGGAGGEAKKS